MITRPTVLVLGAAASRDYGLPQGRELLFMLLRALEQGSKDPARADLLRYGFNAEQLKAFRYQLRASKAQGVDFFLEHQPDHTVRLGKMAMTAVLCPLEDPDQLANLDNKVRWYEYLLHQLVSGVSRMEFLGHQLRIITFNYDRSFEQFFLPALQYHYSIRTEEAAGLLAAIPIVHVHGQLGSLPGSPFAEQLLDDPAVKVSRTYGQAVGADLKNVAECIHVAHEQSDVTVQAYADAHKYLREADVVCFLGFAYHSANMKRLGIDRLMNPDGQRIYGSAFGLTRVERAESLAAFPTAYVQAGAVILGSEEQDVLAVLRNYPVLSARADELLRTTPLARRGFS